MKKNTRGKLGLRRETVKRLATAALRGVNGGGIAIHTNYPCVSWPFSGAFTCDSCDPATTCLQQ